MEHPEDFSHIARSTAWLVPPPVVTEQLVQLSRDECANWQEIARSIEADPAIGLRIQKLVSSSLYGLPVPSSLQQALVLSDSTAASSVARGTLSRMTLRSQLEAVDQLQPSWQGLTCTAFATELSTCYAEPAPICQTRSSPSYSPTVSVNRP